MAHHCILESAMCLLSAEKLRKKYHVHTTQSKQKYLSDFFVSDIILQVLQYHTLPKIYLGKTFFNEILHKYTVCIDKGIHSFFNFREFGSELKI